MNNKVCNVKNIETSVRKRERIGKGVEDEMEEERKERKMSKREDIEKIDVKNFI
jgi:hypothetical protein